MNLNDYISDVYKTSMKYLIPPEMILELVDMQEVKRAYRDKEPDIQQSLDVVKRYLRIQDVKYKKG